MSNGLQQMAETSFFPTAKELSTGIQWFKDHPVLAAAAATAVSVITYLNTTDVIESEEDDEADVVVTEKYGRYAPGSVTTERVSNQRCNATVSSPLPARKPPTKTTAALPPVPITRRTSGGTSDGKLSANVSWCDEHGGSLTQVFEELHVNESDGTNSGRYHSSRRYQSTTNSNSSNSSARRRPTIHIEEKEETMQWSHDDSDQTLTDFSIRKSSIQQSILGSMSETEEPNRAPLAATKRMDELSGSMELELHSESPQWGWYVAITPPQDQFQSGLPRAMSEPVAGSPGSLQTAAMKRSTSGRLP